MQEVKDNNKPITIYNICGVFSIHVETIDLGLLAVKMSNSSYNAKKLPALVIRKTNPRATILLFRTGKSIILGTESVESLQKIAYKLGKELKKLLLIKELKCSEVQITNIMAGCNLGTPILMKILELILENFQKIVNPSKMKAFPECSTN